MSAEAPVVVTTSGPVRGARRSGIEVWRGIPYAAPPVGALRFRPPQPAPAWDGVRDALRGGAVSEQSRTSSFSQLNGIGATYPMSEDCLTLNVFSPAADGARRPVVVWIHGGAFVMGSGGTPIYDGTSFARRHDLVVVTINYRLGLLGSLYLGDLVPGREEGNYNLLDQIAALRWVRDNIAGFGGDPDAVTVMGESAGAFSIGNLLGMPAARGLFRRAILQSGACGPNPVTRAEATALARRVIAELGLDADAPDLVEALAAVPVERFMAVQDRLLAERGLGAVFPYVDGVTIPRSPLATVRAGELADVALLLGTTRDEFNLFALLIGDGAVTTALAAMRARGRDDVDGLLAGYRAALAARASAGAAPAGLEGAALDQRAAIELLGDAGFRIPALLLAESQARAGGAVWMYRFDWASPGFKGKLGAAHALELPFMWNTIDFPFSQFLLGGDVEAARPLALAMHDAWAAFIRTGDPNAPAALPSWPRYDVPRRATMLLDRTSSIADDPGRDLRVLWPDR